MHSYFWLCLEFLGLLHEIIRTANNELFGNNKHKVFLISVKRMLCFVYFGEIVKQECSITQFYGRTNIMKNLNMQWIRQITKIHLYCANIPSFFASQSRLFIYREVFLRFGTWTKKKINVAYKTSFLPPHLRHTHGYRVSGIKLNVNRL